MLSSVSCYPTVVGLGIQDLNFLTNFLTLAVIPISILLIFFYLLGICIEYHTSMSREIDSRDHSEDYRIKMYTFKVNIY